MEDNEILKIVQTTPMLDEQERKVALAIWKRYMKYGQASGVVLVGIKRLAAEAGVGISTVYDAIWSLQKKNLFERQKGGKFVEGCRTQPSQFRINRPVWKRLGNFPSAEISPVGQSTTQPNGSESPGEASTSHIWPSCTIEEDVTTVGVFDTTDISCDFDNQNPFLDEDLRKDFEDGKDLDTVVEMKEYVDNKYDKFVKSPINSGGIDGECLSELKKVLLKFNEMYWKSADVMKHIYGKDTEIRTEFVERRSVV